MESYVPRIEISALEGKYVRTLRSTDLQHYANGSTGLENTQILIIAWSSLLGDSPCDSLKPKRVINQFINRLINDVISVVQSFAALAQELVSNIEYDASRNIIIPFLPGLLKTPVAREFLTLYRTGDLTILRYILSFLWFGKKLFSEDPQLETAAFRSWIDTEERLKAFSYPTALLENLKVVVQFITKDWEPLKLFFPKHGNGAVAERGIKGCISKNEILQMTPSMQRVYFNTPYHLGILSASEMYSMISGSSVEDGRDMSRLMFVPKSYKTFRSICMEPTAYQYAQQGVRLWFEHNLADGMLKDHIVLKDQGVNQRAAQKGSIDSMSDTLDLSQASDSVTWKLVSRIFPAKILKHLHATRTSVVELPNGETYKVSKYAPMGSALCFPVQSTIYAAIIILSSIARLYHVRPDDPRFFHEIDVAAAYHRCYGNRNRGRVYRPFYAYGDDLIVDKAISSIVIAALSSLGFLVNVDKSFFGNQCYRESCGKHYVAGVDVSPYTFKTKKIDRRVSMEALVGIIDQINKAQQYGFTTVRRHLINFALRYPIQGVRTKSGLNPLLFSNNENDSMAILCNTPRNTHLRKRVYTRGDAGDSSCCMLQRDEVRSITLAPLKSKRAPVEDDWYYYAQWWRARYAVDRNRLDYNLPIAKSDTLGKGVGWRWTANPA